MHSCTFTPSRRGPYISLTVRVETCMLCDFRAKSLIDVCEVQKKNTEYKSKRRFFFLFFFFLFFYYKRERTRCKQGRLCACIYIRAHALKKLLHNNSNSFLCKKIMFLFFTKIIFQRQLIMIYKTRTMLSFIQATRNSSRPFDEILYSTDYSSSPTTSNEPICLGSTTNAAFT